MENNQNNTFNYTYSAKQQSEIKSIRDKYLPKEADKMELLRSLDRSVTGKATSLSLAAGIVGTLVMGTGMSFAMVLESFWFVPGIIIGLIGIVLVALAYPIYQRTLAAERKRIAPEILRLSEELMNNNTIIK